MAWKTIDSGPRDGDEFYIGLPVRWKKYKPQARKQGFPEGRFQMANEYGGWDNLSYKPTHWTPLPPLDIEE